MIKENLYILVDDENAKVHWFCFDESNLCRLKETKNPSYSEYKNSTVYKIGSTKKVCKLSEFKKDDEKKCSVFIKYSDVNHTEKEEFNNVEKAIEYFLIRCRDFRPIGVVDSIYCYDSLGFPIMEFYFNRSRLRDEYKRKEKENDD